jgi:tRNA(adenine34) deaminase
MGMSVEEQDEYWMRQALDLAKYAETQGEVPVGAILVKDGKQLACGFNQSITACDPSAHAEIIALRAGAKKLNNYRLLGTTLYATLEPCAMCAGALIHARVERLVFAAKDPRAGAICSAIALMNEKFFNHRIRWDAGILAEESSPLLKEFFKRKRGVKNET